MSDTGTGKTYVATAVAIALRRPTLIVAPKISLTAWRSVAAQFGDEFSVINYEQLRTGRTEFGRWDNQDNIESGREAYYVCENCQQRVEISNPAPCYCHSLGVHCIDTRRTKLVYGKFNFHPGVRSVVFDEVHRCGAERSLNAEILIAARRANAKILGLSATMATEPLKMRALGYALDLHGDKYSIPFKRGYLPMLPNFYQWATRHGCRKLPPMPGLHWAVGEERQRQIMTGIRSQIIPARGVRITTDEIPGFPECDITAEIYDIGKHAEIDSLYGQMASALGVLAHKATTDKAPDHPLTQVLRARQKIELLKVPVAVELTSDYVERGLSIAIFVNFQQTLDELRRILNCNCFIDGTPNGVRYRAGNIDDFQENRSPVILVNNDAGKESINLQDIYGGHPRGGIVFPSFSAVTMKQVFGRLPRDGGKTKCFYRLIFAAGTVEMPVYRRLRGKLNNLDSLNDADLRPDNLPLTKFVK